MSVERSGIHMETHMSISELLADDPHLVEQDSTEGEALRDKIHKHYQEHSGENSDFGIEMDHRHKSDIYPSPTESDGKAPPWDPAHYTPNTFIGSRAPHVFLKDGTSIFDHYGLYWTLIHFSGFEGDGGEPKELLNAARRVDMPLKHVILKGEDNAQRVWEAPLVLIRPDGHVAWRGQVAPETAEAAEIVKVVTGRSGKVAGSGTEAKPLSGPFSATSGMGTQVRDYELERMGTMQSQM